ncbi:MAG TPA: ABC transporter permease [Pseudonocardiaceae bacterium]
MPAALRVTALFWTWYRRNWRASVVSTVLQPLLMLLAFGLAFGSLVEPSAATGNVDYLTYLAPGLLAMTAVQLGVGEATYPVLGCFKWHRSYHGMAATPLTPAQIMSGHLTWITIRIASACAVYLVVIALFGGAPGPGVLLSLVFATLCGLATAAPVLAFSASIDDEGSHFGVLNRFVVLPMTLVAGTFFPVSELPLWARPLAWVSPLWHGTELARGASLETLRPGPVAGHLAYLLLFAVVGAALAARRFRVRLHT